MNQMFASDTLPRLAAWQEAWPLALAHWSKFTRLHDPRLCESHVEAGKEGLTGSFAMIRLVDKSVVINLEKVTQLGLDDYAVEILAHEIGHHVLAPSTVADHFRLLARIRRGLPTLETHAPMIANLYTDLLINDRLQRQAGLRMADVYARMQAGAKQAAQQEDALWALYMGIYESLWKLDKGSLGGPTEDKEAEGDCWLGARLVRVYAQDWMTGAGRFAALVLPYLVKSVDGSEMAALIGDTVHAGQGSEPVGIVDIEADEVGGNIHPSRDAAITGGEPGEAEKHAEPSGRQSRQPFEYGEILKAAGITLSDEAIAVRYYRERALPHLVRFPSRRQCRSTEPQLEGLEPWEMGDPLDEVDWLQSVTVSPQPIPGLTTVRRLYGEEPSTDEVREPVDLDLYVDSSGSMPNPQQQISYLTLAGAIIAMSALKAGASVQASLWSGTHECVSTSSFVRNEVEILTVLTGFFGGGTAFPIHKLRDTYEGRDPKRDRPAHILMISDDGIDTMFATDERGNNGWDVSARALSRAGGGGTMALNLWAGQKADWMDRAVNEQGWDIHAVTDFEQLVAFARAFSQRTYGGLR
jgi:hypothetical protein